MQSALKGKAQAVYTALSVSQSRDYETVKDTVLKAYELVPEAYRLKFRNSYKEPGITHVEYMNDLDMAFERWLRSKEVGGDYNKLRSLILLENFCRCINKEVASYLFEKDICDTEKAAITADEYVLTHKIGQDSRTLCKAGGTVSTYVKPTHSGFSSPSSHSQSNYTQYRGNHNFEQRSNFKAGDGREKKCFYCGRAGHLERGCMLKSTSMLNRFPLFRKAFSQVEVTSYGITCQL